MDASDPFTYEIHSIPTQGGSNVDVGARDFAMEPAADSLAMYIGYNGLTRLPFDGSTASQLDSQGAFYVVADSAIVYYIVLLPRIGADRRRGRVRHRGQHSLGSYKTGGATTTLVAEAPDASQLALSSGYLYWIQGQGYKSTIRRLPIAGGPPETLVSDDEILWFVVDDTNLYWERNAETAFAQAYDVMTAPLASPTSATVVLHQDNDRLALDDGRRHRWSSWSSAWEQALAAREVGRPGCASRRWFYELGEVASRRTCTRFPRACGAARRGSTPISRRPKRVLLICANP